MYKTWTPTFLQKRLEKGHGRIVTRMGQDTDAGLDRAGASSAGGIEPDPACGGTPKTLLSKKRVNFS